MLKIEREKRKSLWKKSFLNNQQLIKKIMRVRWMKQKNNRWVRNFIIHKNLFDSRLLQARIH